MMAFISYYHEINLVSPPLRLISFCLCQVSVPLSYESNGIVSTLVSVTVLLYYNLCYAVCWSVRLTIVIEIGREDIIIVDWFLLQ